MRGDLSVDRYSASKKRARGLYKVALSLLLALLIVLATMGGLTYAIVELTKEVRIDDQGRLTAAHYSSDGGSGGTCAGASIEGAGAIDYEVDCVEVCAQIG